MPPKYNLSTPVIFRIVDGTCTAIFPTLASNIYDSNTCRAYVLGNHCAVDVRVGTRHRLATRAEYMPLKKQLQDEGWRLNVITRIAAAHNQERMQSYNERIATSQPQHA